MPGLVGFTNSVVGSESPQRVLQEMQDLITHFGFYRRDALFSDGCMSATRSSIGIIQKEAQPYSEGGVHVWLDGEFYNQSEICPASSPQDRSDPAILHDMFVASESFDFLRRIDGIYTAVIYDTRKRRLHLITDRYGMKHLHWTVHNGGLAWGSEMKFALAIRGLSLTIDRQSLDDVLLGEGHMVDDRTWFEGVEVLSPATVLTYDVAQQKVSRQKYWSWDDVKPMTGKIDEDALADELGRLVSDAVDSRTRTGRVGIGLSGGLDSRAILAAMPDRCRPIHAVTFGRKGCEDIRIAAMAANVKGAIHHPVDITFDNWLMPRFAGVWWTDGQDNLLHLHRMAALSHERSLYDVCLDGFFGEVIIGGGYIDWHPGRSEMWMIHNRSRRFIQMGARLAETQVCERHAFCANRFVELGYSVPRDMTRNSYLYNKMLLRTFPEFYMDIPWTSTGLPISTPPLVVKIRQFPRKVRFKLAWYLRRLGIPCPVPYVYHDYGNWIRREPARSTFVGMLMSPDALWRQHVPPERVENVLARHLKGENLEDKLCRLLTFELWLQQAFQKRYRPGPS